MEEILASIRRIIAEDQDLPKEAGAGSEQPDGEAGVLELSDPVTVASEAEPVVEPEPPPQALPDLEIAVPEVVFSNDPVEQESPSPVQPEPARPLAAAVKAAAQPSELARVEAQAITEELLSSAAGASVGQAFNMLSHTVLNRNARTLEDLVKEMLKPMLKMWLDDNLPPLVERLVRAEIERVARGRN
ncbi:PopZ family protein [Enterovirga sp. CN4-39]|uniref:PopZ family protein n=1 Tax=Enterovirga sp. CN4-39 TaxID=3400910 RepID=UPI003C034689